MKKKTRRRVADDLRPEYDMKALLKGAVKGKYFRRYREASNVVVLAPDVASAFPNADAVNSALRLVLEMTKIPVGR